MVLSLDSEDLARGAHGLGGQFHATLDRVRIAQHQFFIFGQKRFALGAVGQHDFDIGVEFDIGRKPGAACANYSGFSHLFN